MMASKKRLRVFLLSLLATAGLIVAACFTVNCLVDPLWYLRGNVISGINYPFNERLSKIVRFLPRRQEYDCIIFGTSRSTLLPEDKVAGHRCFNLAVSDGQVSESLLYAKYLRERGFTPSLIIVEIRRSDLVGPVQPPNVPDFIRTGAAPPSIFATYLSLDALDFSIRTLRRDPPHHRYYDAVFGAQLEVRSKRHYYNPTVPIAAAPGPFDLHPERAAQYIELRQQFPTARAIGYVPLESAWRIAAFSLTPGFDAYLAVIGQLASGYDRVLDFSLPSPLTKSKDPAVTYDGLHYSRQANERVVAALLADQQEAAVDWRRVEMPAMTALFHQRLADFLATTGQAEAHVGPSGPSPRDGRRNPRSDSDEP
jgi:hypothetical protein